MRTRYRPRTEGLFAHIHRHRSTNKEDAPQSEEYESHYVRYRSPTESGHSGSPVYDRQLNSFAIHHRAREDKKLNEGIILKEIQSALFNNLQSGAGL